MATTKVAVDCRLFHMMLYIIILKVRKFHKPTANRFCTGRQKHLEGCLTTVNLSLKLCQAVLELFWSSCNRESSQMSEIIVLRLFDLPIGAENDPTVD